MVRKLLPQRLNLADADISSRFPIAGSRSSQTIGHSVVLTTDVGYREIE